MYLTAHSGGLVCMVGRTGMGKSTILSLLLRRYDPAVGSPRDGGDRRVRPNRSPRQRIALVPADPWVMDDTVARNIAFGRPGATPEEIAQAGEVALGRRFVAALPDGYDTVVGVGGMVLSESQVWRLALARAVLRGPDVLLLDEPTRGLDPDCERAVMDAIERAAAGRIALVVSHRLRLTTPADRIRVMSGGEVIGSGVPAELIALGRAFAGWCRADLAGSGCPMPELVGTR